MSHARSICDPDPGPAHTFRLTGGSGAPRGTLYGVFELLHEFGVRFYAWDYTYVPATALFPPVNKTVVPALEYRDNNEYTTTGKPAFAVHARINHVRTGKKAFGLRMC